MRKSGTFVILTLLMTATLTLSQGDALATRPQDTSNLERFGQPAQIKAIGHPRWIPVGFQRFSYEIGTAPSSYTSFCENIQLILPPPKHKHYEAASLCVGPGQAHRPPYNQEISRGVAALDAHVDDDFKVNEFSDGEAVWLAWMTVPFAGPWGRSPDFRFGPIIPNSIFPITVTGESTHDGDFFSILADDTFKIPALTADIDPSFAKVDGHSHLPVFIVDNADFGPKGETDFTGQYVWRLRMVDKTGAGWTIETKFEIHA